MYRTPPWEITPSYAQLRGFHQGMMMPDMLHVWSLGVARDLIGSSLKVILQVQDVFDGGTIKARLKQASESLRSFARRRKYHLRIRKLTKSKLTWKTRKYPELCCSGYDSFVVGSWLEEILQPHSEKFPEITSMLWASNKAVSLMYAGFFFLTPGEKSSLEMLGVFFLKLYIRMANKAISEHKLLFRVRPKLHMLNHCFFPHAVRTRLPTAHGWMKTILKKWGRFWMLWTTKRHLSGFYKGGHFHCQSIWKWLWGTERNLCLKRWEKWIASFDLSAVKPNVFMLCFHTYTVQITNNMCVFCFSWLDPHLPVFVPMYIDIYISHQLHFRVLSFFDLRRLWNKQTTCH